LRQSEGIIPVTAILEKNIFTFEDINSIPEGNYEIIDGERRDITPTGFEHGNLESIFSELLRKLFKDKGYVAVGEVGILIKKTPLRLRAADVVYISKEKCPEKPKGILEIAPDLIIEIISESNTSWELTDKAKDYLSIGVGKIIMVDPRTETVSIYLKGKREISLYGFDEEFELMDGFMIRMKEIMS
jgi:Uma2 family endonuclease